jgi:hypothetical protein
MICLAGNNIENYYQLQFLLKDNYHYSVDEYDNLVPYERDIVVALVKDKEERKKMEAEAQKRH